VNILIKILVGIVAFLLIYYYLLPLIPAPLHTIILVILVLIAIIWLLDIAGVVHL